MFNSFKTAILLSALTALILSLAIRLEDSKDSL